MDNQNFGKEIFTKSFDPDLIHGWGKRPYNWEMGVSVQQELVPRVGLTVGYFRRWFGNFYTADNRLTTTSDYTQFSVPIPVDPRLPGGGGGAVTGVYNLVPNKVGQEDLAALDQQLRRRSTENWHGVDSRDQRAAAERPHDAGRHEHGPHAPGQLRGAGAIAGDLQLVDRSSAPACRLQSREATRRRDWPTRIAGSSSHSRPRSGPGHLRRAEARSPGQRRPGGATRALNCRPTTS